MLVCCWEWSSREGEDKNAEEKGKGGGSEAKGGEVFRPLIIARRYKTRMNTVTGRFREMAVGR